MIPLAIGFALALALFLLSPYAVRYLGQGCAFLAFVVLGALALWFSWNRADSRGWAIAVVAIALLLCAAIALLVFSVVRVLILPHVF